MNTVDKLTPESAALLVTMINEAEYESSKAGCMNESLMNFTPSQRGNLTDLKKKGFVDTMDDSETSAIWVFFEEPARPLYEALKGA